MKVWRELNPEARAAALARPTVADSTERDRQVARIVADVRTRGDAAIEQWSRELDGESPQLPVTRGALQKLADTVPDEFAAAARLAAANIEAFHQACAPRNVTWVGAQGQTLTKAYTPLRRVGLYIPGGSAPLISTLMMLAIPARLAGCDEVILCTPPQQTGIAPELAWAALEFGVDAVYAVGGAQAIAAMAFGTASIPACDKLFGPGNGWVTAAKGQVSVAAQGPGIDMLAGPSEALIIADASANPDWVAADLLAQAEHGPDSNVILLSDDAGLIQRVEQCLEQRLTALPRANIARQALADSALILTESLDEALAIANDYAPEHLLIQVADPEPLVAGVRAAGSVFVGTAAAESFGDYSSGSNHVLPTGGTARYQGTVDVASFTKAMSIQRIDAAAARALAPATRTLAETEGLKAHADAAACRAPDLEEAVA